MSCTGYCHCGRQQCPHPEQCRNDPKRRDWMALIAYLIWAATAIGMALMISKQGM